MYSSIFKQHATLLKALAHPKRLEIVHLLRHQPLTVTAIHEMLALPQANVSQHLKILRDASVVTTDRRGKEVRYRIAHRNFIHASDAVRSVLIARSSEELASAARTRPYPKSMALFIDPVCGMQVSVQTAGATLTSGGRRYYFCGNGCKSRYQQHADTHVHERAD